MRPLAKLCLVTIFAIATLAFPAAGPVTAQSVAALRAELDRAGTRMEQAAEGFNAARLKRSRLDGELATARHRVAESQGKLNTARGKLGFVVRNLYMHPAAGLGTFFQAHSYGELERGSAIASRLALSTDTLILQVRKAKAEEQSTASNLKSLRDQARDDELAMANERRAAASAYANTKRLLAAANGAVARELEAERLAGLRAAPALAKESIHFTGKISPGAATAVRVAEAQIGKPYVWGAAGPDSFDCSGLTMYAWAAAGVRMDHYTGSQYAAFPRVPLDQLAPGDLVFFGSDLHHEGMYEGNGIMIHAPHTGDYVKRSSIWEMGSPPVGAVRPS